MKRIEPGVKFWHDGQRFECLSVNEGSATCESRGERTVTLTDAHGKTRTFTARGGKTVHLAPTTLVEEAP